MASKKFRPLGPKIAAKKGGNWKCQLAVEPFFVHIFYKFFQNNGDSCGTFCCYSDAQRTPCSFLLLTIYFSNVRRRESPPPPFSGQKIRPLRLERFLLPEKRENVQVFGKRFNCAPLTDTSCRFL
jgi:hypothetical protein